MFRFLPQETRARATKVYKERRFLVVTFGLVILSVLSLVELVPLYVLSSVKISVGDTGKNAVATSTPETLISQSARDTEILQKVAGVPTPLDFQKRLLSLPRSGIKLNGFSWKVIETGEEIKVSGVALRREALVAFVKTMQKDTRFKGIDLPVSYLLKEKDIDFTLSGTFSPK